METYLISLPAIAGSVREARVLAAEAAVELGADGRVVDDVRLCVSEAVANVVLHAYDATGDVEVEIERDGDELVAIVRDTGVGLLRTSGRERAAGGLGMKILETVAQRVSVESVDDAGTEVRMVFPLVAEAGTEA